MQNFDYLGHMAKFGRQIDTVEEFEMRLAQFSFVHNYIEEHNASGANYQLGHNQFSDWSHVEYKQLLGYAGRGGRPSSMPIVSYEVNDDAQPIDWRDFNAVTAVKDQGQCGSCWAFSTTGSLEGAHVVAGNDLESFSEQQLVDCAYFKYGNLGCNGGLQEYAYNYYEAGHKAELESVYPYTSGGGVRGSCQYNESSATAVTVSDYVQVTADSVTDMKAALAIQPLAVSIEADHLCFQFYTSGVFDNVNCGTSLDHAVLAVGWGVEGSQEYWIVKNSWNTTWGDQGYIKIAIVDGAGICGVQMEPLQVTTN